MSYRAMNWAWNLTDLGMAESFILVSLVDQANDDGYCWPSQATLAARSRQSERSVRRNLARLEEYGLIKVVRRSTQGGRRSNLYWLNVGADFSLQTKQPDNLAGCARGHSVRLQYRGMNHQTEPNLTR
ncbi:helix-turn-helix domain-containing protein [Actinomyces trachealis]|uniref:helix-turn-helix domain-containing protein n=1 Tax=Actinomyces trachealis TaxID=2763540 RepID=UPI001892AD62|nr:helix-turn-helix domain-containing protein [Actinomyces trachealis]